MLINGIAYLPTRDLKSRKNLFPTGPYVTKKISLDKFHFVLIFSLELEKTSQNSEHQFITASPFILES